MNRGCQSDCSCCVEGECRSALSCNSVLQMLVIVGSVFGALLLLVLGLCVAFRVARCLRRRKLARRVAPAPHTSGRTPVLQDPHALGPDDSAIADLLEARGSGDASSRKGPLVRAFPDKEIPTTVPLHQDPLVPYRISKLEPILVIVGDKPTGRPKYLTDSIKSLVQPKTKIEPLKSVVVKQNSTLRSNGTANKPLIIEEVEQNDISNISLMDKKENSSSPKQSREH
jgi:hypothetical protein